MNSFSVSLFKSSSLSRADSISDIIFLTLSGLNSKSQCLLEIYFAEWRKIKIVKDRRLFKIRTGILIIYNDGMPIFDNIIPEREWRTIQYPYIKRIAVYCF